MRIDIRSGEFCEHQELDNGCDHDPVSVSIEQGLLKTLSQFVAVAYEVFVGTADGMVLAKTAAEVGMQLAATGVEKYLVRDTCVSRVLLCLCQDQGEIIFYRTLLSVPVITPLFICANFSDYGL